MNLGPETQPHFCIIEKIKGNKGVREILQLYCYRWADSHFSP